MAMRNCRTCHQPREDHRYTDKGYKTPAACDRYRERKMRSSERRIADLQAFWRLEHPRGAMETLVDYEARMPKRLELSR